MQSMAMKHTAGRWNLKRYAKRVLFKTYFALFWAQKGVIGATNQVHNTLNGDQKCFFTIYVGSKAIGPLHGLPRHPNCSKKAIFGHFSQILKWRSATCDTCSRPPPLSF